MTNNKLKIIAIITMIIDHFGYYFNFWLTDEIYLICRVIGRIAMPIFTYLIVEGYFNTSSFSKYIKRLGILAVITQIIAIILDILASKDSYKIGYTVNILFSFVALLILFKLFENAITSKKFKSKLLFVVYILVIYILYKLLNFDYGIYVLVLGAGMYIIKKYINNVYLYKIGISLLIVIVSLVMGSIRQFALLSILPIILYNGKLGKKSTILKRTFYYIFPLQHFLLYGMYILIK